MIKINGQSQVVCIFHCEKSVKLKMEVNILYCTIQTSNHNQITTSDQQTTNSELKITNNQKLN